MQLFAPPEKSPWISPTNSIGSLEKWIKQEFLRQKLQTPFGYLLMVGTSLLMASVIGAIGWQAGAIFLVTLLVFPLLVGAMFHLRFGIYLTVGAAFCVMGLKRLTGGAISFGIFLDLCLMFMAFGLLVQQTRKRDLSPLMHPFTVLIVLWSIYNLVELINPLAPSQLAWMYVVRDVAGRMYIFFIVLFAFQRIDHFRILLRIWLLFSTLAAIYAIVQEWGGLQPFELAWLDTKASRIEKLYLNGWVRKFSFLGDPSTLGLVMGYSSMIGLLMLFLPGRSNVQKIVLVGSIALMWVAMILSGTRTAYLALPASLLFLFALSLDRRILISLAVVMALGTTLYFWPSDKAPIQRYQSTFQPSQTASVAELLQNQAYAKKLIQQHPIGQGLGTTGMRGQQFSPYTLLSRFPSHSGYLMIGLEMGWLGLLLYCSMLFVVLAVGVRSFLRTRDPVARIFLMIFISVCFYLIICNYSQKSLIGLPSSIIFPCCLAGIVLVTRWERAGKLWGKA